MFNLEPGKLLIVGVVTIILLGPDKLPEVARQIGGAWRTFGEFRSRMEKEVHGNIPDLPSTAEVARLVRSPSALLNHLSRMGPEGETASDAASPSAKNPDVAAGAGIEGPIQGHSRDRESRHSLPQPQVSHRSPADVSGDPGLN